jgi:hypothetical protein
VGAVLTVIAGGGPLTRCAPSCPANALQIGSAPRLVEVAGKAETYTALAIAVAVWAVYFTRLRAASRPQRRALVAVAVTSLLFLPTYFVFNFAAWILYLEPRTLDTLAWGIVGTRILLPVGFLIALLQAERFAATSSRTLLERLCRAAHARAMARHHRERPGRSLAAAGLPRPRDRTVPRAGRRRADAADGALARLGQDRP